MPFMKGSSDGLNIAPSLDKNGKTLEFPYAMCSYLGLQSKI